MEKCEDNIKFFEFHKFNNFTINKNDTLLKVLKDIDDNFTSVKSSLLTKCDCSELPSNITLTKVSESESSVVLRVNATNATKFKYSEGGMFVGSNLCSGFAGNIGDTFILELPVSNTKFITVRVYDNNCQHHLDKTFTVSNNNTVVPVPVNNCTAITNATITGSTSAIPNVNNVYTVTYQGDTATALEWIVSGQGNTIVSGGTTDTVVVNFVTSGSIYCLLSNNCTFITATSNIIDVIYQQVPVPIPVPLPIPVPVPVCVAISELSVVGSSSSVINQNRQYQATYEGTTVTSYSWSVTNGTIVSGQATNIANIVFTSTGTSTITLAVQSCGQLFTSTYNVTVSSVPVPTPIPVPLPVLVSCNPAGRTFSLSSVVYDLSSQSITYQYDAENLVNAIAYIRDSGGTIIKTITGIVHTANTKTLTLDSPLPAGNYTFDLVGTSCQGTASKTFTAQGCAISITVNSITC